LTRVTLIAGGVGGARMAEGFAALEDVDLTVIGNVADDEEFHGLWVSPDIDTMLYTLSGRVNRDQGWGVADEGRRALDTLGDLGEDTWMFLGDRDFGLHIYRTERLRRGERPSDITSDIAKRFGISARIVLPTDNLVQTRVRTSAGWLSFQEYFVKERCEPEVLELRYEGLNSAELTGEAAAALDHADLIVIAPSNPLVSVAPILDLPGARSAIKKASAPVIAVSPLIAGKGVKGPADRMMRSLGLRANALGIAGMYQGLVDGFLLDDADRALAAEISGLGMAPRVTDIMMPDLDAKRRLASEILGFFESLSKGDAA
jgi:LPPG:FO 2-phospho-L-lactate transferase